MRANQNVDHRASDTTTFQAPRASTGLRCKSGLRAGEAKKQEAYLVLKLEECIVTSYQP